MARSKVHVEEFRSLEGDPFARRSTQAGADKRDRAGDGAVLVRSAIAQVELDGESHEVDWPQDSTLVDAMLDAGLDAPYSCLEGCLCDV